MTRNVWLGASTLTYPAGGGHLWIYLNWALGLRENGCRVVWLEAASAAAPAASTRALVASLRERLAPYAFDEIALCASDAAALPAGAAEGCVDLAEAREADLLLDLSYEASSAVRGLFRRSALLDIDPGLTQVWLSEGLLDLSGHDVYLTTGETVGTPRALFPAGGLEWHHVPPAVAVGEWGPAADPGPDAPFTTVSHWSTSKEWFVFAGESFRNDKRSGFLPVLDLPAATALPLELALALAPDEEEEERGELERRGWRVVHAHEVAGTPWDYRSYVRASRGELSAAKPSCVRLQNAWVSDRTLCYLASGRPAVVQDTGPSELLPNGEGIFRFRDLAGAARALETVAADYERQSRLARELAEARFDARTAAARVLTLALA